MGLMKFFGRRAPARALSADPGTEPEQMLVSLLVTAWFIEARDPNTGGHLWRVSRYAALLCERAGIAPEQSARIAIGGFLHDLGHIGIPEAILRKRARLTSDEVAIIKTHPDVGSRLLADHPLVDLVRDAVLSHHETPDGRGYPSGMAGHAIPLAARIVGLCDALDAMTSARPYRCAMPIAQAMERIESRLGRQFDEPLGRHFLALGAEGLLHHIAGHSDDGILLQRCTTCDSPLVVHREQRAGDALFCRNCGAAYHLESGHDDALLKAVPGGSRGSAADLAPVPDMQLIRRLARDTAQHFVFAIATPSSGGAPLESGPVRASTSALR